MHLTTLQAYGKVKAKRLAENYDVEIHKLPADLQLQQKHNMHLMDLTQGLVEHPDERHCYEQQLQKISLTCAQIAV